MAVVPVDVAVLVKGQNKLDRLQKRFDRLELVVQELDREFAKAFGRGLSTSVNQSANSISNLNRQLNGTDRALKKINSQRGAIERATGGGGGAGGAGGGAFQAVALGSVAGSQRRKRITQEQEELFASLQSKSKELVSAQEQLAKAAGKVNDNLAKQAANQERIEDLSRQVRIQEGQVKRLRGKSGKELDAAKRLLGETKNELRSVNASQRGLTQSAERFNTELAESQRRVDAINKKLGGQALRGARKSFGGLATSVAKAAAAYFTFQTVVSETGRVFRATIERTSADRRLRALARGYNETAEAADLARNAARRFGLSNTEATGAVAQLYGRLRPLGLTLKEIEAVMTGFNTAARLSGATASETAGALLQLTQGLGAGALRGQELNSVLEQAPLVAQAIAKELNTTVGSLKKLGEEGAITSEVVVKALSDISTSGADKLAESLDTPAQRLKTLNNRLEDLRVNLGKLALPTVLTVVDSLATQTEKWADAVDDLGDAWRYVASKLGFVVDGLKRVKFFFDNITPQGWLLKLLGVVGTETPGWIKNFAEIQRQMDKDAFIGPPAPQWYGPAPINNPTKPLSKRLGVEEDEDKEAEAALKRQLQLGQELARQFKVATIERAAQNDVERQILQAQLQWEENQTRINQIKDGELRRLLTELNMRDKLAEMERIRAAAAKETADKVKAASAPLLEQQKYLKDRLELGEKEAKIRREIARLIKEGLDPAYAEELVRQAAALQQLNDAADRNRQILEQTLNGVGREMTNLFDNLIQGTNDWNATLRNTLRSLSSLLLKAGISALDGGDGRGFFSFLNGGLKLDGRANGGPVTGGTPYVVGERGPEVFVPGSNGGIVPNDALGGDVQIVQNFYVGSEGSDSTSASGKGQKEEMVLLARMMETTALGVINRERRPGGVLSR